MVTTDFKASCGISWFKFSWETIQREESGFYITWEKNYSQNVAYISKQYKICEFKYWPTINYRINTEDK